MAGHIEEIAGAARTIASYYQSDSYIQRWVLVTVFNGSWLSFFLLNLWPVFDNSRNK